MDIHKVYRKDFKFAESLAGRMKYVLVNQDGSYTIGYDDGSVFGGHEMESCIQRKTG